MTLGTKRVLLAAPRGYCAGVDRAVITVEKALDLYGAPVYVRKEIVHNKHVVATLEARGAIFVAENDEVPEGQEVFLELNAELAQVWPNITEMKDAPADAAEWDGVENKLQYLER